ncbi:hypothetical protein CHU92_02720 [Flavobacterium cyanobacteriorum]|uniref:Uncharacterized protein n=1 Tax=Flavobacterium cyanobacteriorum TaxID=2022802 RepID=A0A255ZR48_9FLAO|nr:hypothetical protein CHU92_02720 [Flavobacterium cyanobacteriorum]
MISINLELSAACNSRFVKAGVSCFYESEVLNSSFVLLLKFCAENPRLRKAAKRCAEIPTGFPHNCPGDLPPASPPGLSDNKAICKMQTTSQIT